MSEWGKQNEEKNPKKRDKRHIYKCRDILILTFSIPIKIQNWKYILLYKCVSVCVCACLY